MPSIPVHPPAADRDRHVLHNPLPSVLHTPSGLAMIEIQGTILSEDTTAGVSQALQLGRLVFPPAEGQDESSEWDGKRVFLFIGKHQRMTGEVRKLAKPIGVLRRRTGSEGDTAGAEQVEIAEIIYQKLLFSHRPEPMGAAQLLEQEAS